MKRVSQEADTFDGSHKWTSWTTNTIRHLHCGMEYDKLI